MEQKISFLLNGRQVTLRDVEPETTLIMYLRSPYVALMGTKSGCDSGFCGSCTVLVIAQNPDGSKSYLPILACRYPLIACDGKAIVTIECLLFLLYLKTHLFFSGEYHYSTAVEPHSGEVRTSQCNAMRFLHARVLDERHSPDQRNKRPSLAGRHRGGWQSSSTRPFFTLGCCAQAMGGHLCRCTGYRTISDCLREFIVEAADKEVPRFFHASFFFFSCIV